MCTVLTNFLAAEACCPSLNSFHFKDKNLLTSSGGKCICHFAFSFNFLVLTPSLLSIVLQISRKGLLKSDFGSQISVTWVTPTELWLHDHTLCTLPEEKFFDLGSSHNKISLHPVLCGSLKFWSRRGLLSSHTVQIKWTLDAR